MCTRRAVLENPLNESFVVQRAVNGIQFLLCSVYRAEYTKGEFYTRLDRAIEQAYEL